MEGKPTYICTDSSRNVFNFKNKDGQLEKDYKAKKLTETICPAVITKSENIFKKFNTKETSVEYIQKLIDIKKMKVDNDKFVNELSILTSNASNTNLANKNETIEEFPIEQIVEEYTDEELIIIDAMSAKKRKCTC